MRNGLPERMDTTMINVLKKLTDNSKANWKDLLAKMTFAYYSTVNKSTGFTRFYLVFRRESRISILEIIYCCITLKKKKELEI